jgi:hypothetical protein
MGPTVHFSLPPPASRAATRSSATPEGNTRPTPEPSPLGCPVSYFRTSPSQLPAVREGDDDVLVERLGP